MNTQKIKRAPAYRPSFTLIELLVAIAIIGVMVGMVMFSLAGAQQDAMVGRTRGTISKINDVILQEWEKFRYRSVRIDVPSDWLRPVVDASGGIVGQPPLSPRESSRLRLIVLRDTMRMEMPDRMTDILYPPTMYITAGNTANNGGSSPVFTDDRQYVVPTRAVPGKLNNYRNKFGLASIITPYSGPVTGNANPNPQNQSAELLYQIVAAANFQSGSALELFRPTEIGDTDEDGLPEFVDAWERPIRWIRWPAGYVSPLNDTSTPDPMDPVRTDWRHSKISAYQRPAFTPKPWLLVPLVVSAGPDGVFDLTFDLGTLAYATQTWGFPTDSAAHGNSYFFPDPYIGTYDVNGNDIRGNLGAGLGAPFDENNDGSLENVTDNITNYELILE
ncbi:MAG: type II secretion system protein [Pirellulaceae bacterium]